MAEALAKEPTTPIHDAYLKEGEEPRREAGSGAAIAIGFHCVGEANRLVDVFITTEKKR